MNRFVVLDSWRGIAACLVALFHFDIYNPYGHLHGVSLLSHAYLFVDFFFVLSGFVMAANYQQRLLAGYGVGRFMMLRLGRLYPLHIVMLAIGVAFKLLLLIPALSTVASTAPFQTPEEAPGTILAHLLLIQSLHVYPYLTWTLQSWSISTEFYTCMLFAICLVVLRKRSWIGLAAAMTAGPLAIAVLSDNNMATTYDWGIIRCIYGFSAGVIVWNLYRRWHGPLANWLSGSAAEWGTIGLIVVFVNVAGFTWLSIAAPYVFGLAVLVFSFEAGAASALLRQRALLFLGAISYSLYMTHVFIVRRMLDSGKILDVYWDKILTRREINGRPLDVFGAETWQSDLAMLIFLGLVIAGSYVTYRFIEVPARKWVRNRALPRVPTVQSVIDPAETDEPRSARVMH